jgi:hypothetical protein
MQPTSATPETCIGDRAFELFDQDRIIEDGPLADQLEMLTSKYQEKAGFLALLPDKENSIYLIMGLESTSEEVVDMAKKDQIEVAASCVSTEDLDRVQEVASTWNYRDGEFFSIGYSAFDDAILVTSTIPRDEGYKGLTRGGVSLKTGMHATINYIEVETESVGRLGRSNDAAPHWGGAQIWRSGAQCSSGFTVVNSTGDRAIMSAGHCFELGQSIENGVGSSVGTVVFRTFPDPDLLSISGSSYVGRHYSEVSDVGGRRVQGSTDPALNVGYCEYGAVGLRICTGYVTTNTTYTDASGSTTNLAQALSAPGCPFGRLARSGDSGGPVGREIADGVTGARGIVVAGTSESAPITSTTRCTRWDHKWSTVSSIFNVSIVNG